MKGRVEKKEDEWISPAKGFLPSPDIVKKPVEHYTEMPRRRGNTISSV